MKDTTGKVLFEMGGFYYVCSASVATEAVSGRSVVVSAGHCVFDETNVEFATNWMFIPDYDAAPAPIDTGGNFCAQTEWGCWTATSLVVHEGYASAGGFNDQAVRHDWGFAVVGPGGHNNAHLDATVGTKPVSLSSVSTGTTVSAFGYPAAGKYKGNDLIYCQGPVGTDAQTANTTYKVACTMTGWVIRRALVRTVRQRHGDRNPDVGQLLRLHGRPVDVRSEVQRQHPGHLERSVGRQRQHHRRLIETQSPGGEPLVRP